MKMIGNKILVQQQKTKAVSEGGIALPDTCIQVLPYGKVLKVGPDVDNVKIGEVVLFSAIGAVELGDLLEDCVLIEPDDILVILEEGDY